MPPFEVKQIGGFGARRSRAWGGCERAVVKVSREY
jgi:hypothetical protein